MFTPEEKMQLFNRLPALELSYEPRLHKKVYAEMYYIIPKGPKALVWYTYWQDQHVCLLILLNERGNYSDIKVFPSCFSDAMALGTLIYGTHFMHQQRAYFTCEHMHYYKGMPVTKGYLEQLPLLLNMFQSEIEQVAYTTHSLVLGIPVMTKTYEEALVQLNELPYRTYGIGGIRANATRVPAARVLSESAAARVLSESAAATRVLSESAAAHSKATNKASAQQKHEAFQKGGLGQQTLTPLLVKAALSADTYQLYEPATNTFIGTAMIPTYKSSVFLNGLFRTIKENTNLDLLEESDDEEEFENTHLDKFVNLDKTILMECVFLKRFQKWQPMKVIKIY
jgi:hypothetical protein